VHAKGKEAKPYELGIRVVLSKQGTVGSCGYAFPEPIRWILEPTIKQVERVACYSPEVAIVDRGYRGKRYVMIQ